MVSLRQIYTAYIYIFLTPYTAHNLYDCIYTYYMCMYIAYYSYFIDFKINNKMYLYLCYN